MTLYEMKKKRKTTNDRRMAIRPESYDRCFCFESRPGSGLSRALIMTHARAQIEKTIKNPTITITVSKISNVSPRNFFLTHIACHDRRLTNITTGVDFLHIFGVTSVAIECCDWLRRKGRTSEKSGLLRTRQGTSSVVDMASGGGFSSLL